jgi:hypothetical protein
MRVRGPSAVKSDVSVLFAYHGIREASPFGAVPTLFTRHHLDSTLIYLTTPPRFPIQLLEAFQGSAVRLKTLLPLIRTTTRYNTLVQHAPLVGIQSRKP